MKRNNLFSLVLACIPIILLLVSIGCDNGNNPDTKETVVTPTANPVGGAVAIGTAVSLSSTTTGSTIFYTIDGTEPNESKILYSTPITINNPVTIKAIAVKDGMNDSGILSVSYSITSGESGMQIYNQDGSLYEGNDTLSYYFTKQIFGNPSNRPAAGTFTVANGKIDFELPASVDTDKLENSSTEYTGGVGGHLYIPLPDGKCLYLKKESGMGVYWYNENTTTFTPGGAMSGTININIGWNYIHFSNSAERTIVSDFDGYNWTIMSSPE
jgi:hypothetical protein